MQSLDINKKIGILFKLNFPLSMRPDCLGDSPRNRCKSGRCAHIQINQSPWLPHCTQCQCPPTPGYFYHVIGIAQAIIAQAIIAQAIIAQGGRAGGRAGGRSSRNRHDGRTDGRRTRKEGRTDGRTAHIN